MVEASLDHMLVGALVGVGKVQHAVAPHFDLVVAEPPPGVAFGECLEVLCDIEVVRPHKVVEELPIFPDIVPADGNEDDLGTRCCPTSSASSPIR